MVRKRDLIIVLGALLIAAAALFVTGIFSGGGEEPDSVFVYVNGALHGQYPLTETGEIRVEQEDGSVNVIAVTGEGVYMAYSTCDNQLCVDQGAVTPGNWRMRALGRRIVCLPNRVMVEISAAEGVPAPDLPDV